MPSRVETGTTASRPLGASNVTANTRAPPSSVDASDTLKLARGSSSVIVPTATSPSGSASDAPPVGSLNCNKNVSASSSRPSWGANTDTVVDSSPGRIHVGAAMTAAPDLGR